MKLLDLFDKPYNILMEKILKIPSYDGFGVIHILHNPTKRAFEKFATERGNDLRGLLSSNDKDIYLWDAGSAFHEYVRDNLGLDRVDYITYNNGKWAGQVVNLYDENGLYIPIIQRITPLQTPRWTKDDDEFLRQLFDEE